MHNDFNLSGPYGYGLFFSNTQKESTKEGQKTIVIFVGGTGILPFLDLFDFLLKKLLFLMAVQQVGADEAKAKIDPLDCGYADFLNGYTFKVYAAFGT